jgi:hypothetical protein
MRRAIKLAPSKEEKVAVSISRLLSDFSLDLEAIGFYLAKAIPYTVFRRALEVLESAEYNHQAGEYDTRGKSYHDRLR